MSKPLIIRAGIDRAPREACAPKHRSIAFVELITTAALALSTAIAVTAVSIGMARAHVLGAVTNGDRTPFAIALFFGLLLAAMGALTAIMAGAPQRAGSFQRFRRPVGGGHCRASPDARQ
jgi:hypothetical protein